VLYGPGQLRHTAENRMRRAFMGPRGAFRSRSSWTSPRRPITDGRRLCARTDQAWPATAPNRWTCLSVARAVL